jgi:hypothetical protein
LTLWKTSSRHSTTLGDIEWTDKDKVNEILTQQIPADMKKDEKIMDAITTSQTNKMQKYLLTKNWKKLCNNTYLHKLKYLRSFQQTKIFKKDIKNLFLIHFGNKVNNHEKTSDE